MNYRHANDYNFGSGKGTGWGKPTLVVFAVVGLYLWGSALFVDLFSFVTYPFLRLTGAVSESFGDALKNKKLLLVENKRLQADNDRLRVVAEQIGELKTENEQLRGIRQDSLALKNPVYSKVLVKPDHLPYDEIIIDIGSAADPLLKVGQLVFADPGVVLGQIESVSSHFAKVKLYSEGGVSLPVNVGIEAVPSVALGLGGGNFSLTLPRGVVIKNGDSVKTSIIGDFVLGYVARIDKNPNDPFQKIQFRSPYNIFTLQRVFVSHD